MITTFKNIITLSIMLAIGIMFWFALGASAQVYNSDMYNRQIERQRMIDADQAARENMQEQFRHEQHMRMLDQQPNTMELPVCPASPTGDCFYRGEEYFR